MKIRRECLGDHKAFTLIELLVVIAIIALLLAILTPALNKARGQARLVICTSNIKQISYGLMAYATNFDSKYPLGNPITGAPGEVWGIDRMLLQSKIIEHPDIFSCPTDMSQKGTRDNPATPALESVTRSYSFNISGIPYWYGLWNILNVRSPSQTITTVESQTPLNYLYGDGWQGYFGPLRTWGGYWPCKPYHSYRVAVMSPSDPAYDSAELTHLTGANFGYVDGHIEFLKDVEFSHNKPASTDYPELRRFVFNGKDAWPPNLP